MASAVPQQPLVIQLYQQAMNALSQNQIDQAIALSQQVLKQQPQFAPAYKVLGMAYQIKGEDEQAKSWYTKALELQPNFPEIYANLGSLYAKQQQWQTAIEVYQKAIELQPNKAGIYRNLAKVFMQIQQPQKATDCWYKAFQLEPEWGTAQEHLTLGNQLFAQQRFELAQVCYKQVIQLDPTCTEAYHNLGEVYRQLLNANSAVNCYQQAVKLNPQSVESWQKLGELWTELKQWDDAIAAYQKTVQLNPNCFESYQKLAQLLRQQQQHSAAIVAYFKAMKLKPYFQWSYLDLWQYLATHQKLADAIEFYQTTVNQYQNAPLVELNLAEALTRFNQPQAAIPHYQQASFKKLQQSNPEIAEQYWDQQQVLPPQFLIIGTQKGGTTSLYQYLKQHPQVIPSIRKEIYFWNYYYRRGLDWYLAHFPQISPAQQWMTGEASPNYLEDKNAPSRLWEVFPKMKLIVLLRNPVDRAISQYYHWLRIHREQQALEQVMKTELEWLTSGSNILNIHPRYWKETSKYVWRGLYVKFLQNWMAVFPPEQFLILCSEDFYTQPQQTLTQVFEFLNLPPYSEINFKPHNQGNYQPIPEAVRQPLQTFFDPFNRRLEAFLGMKLNWN